MSQPHFGVANVAISGDIDKGLDFVVEAQSLLRTTLEQMRVRNISTLSAQRRFSGDCYCYVVCAAGYNMVRIVHGYGDALQQGASDVTFPVAIPDFLSGAVVQGYIIEPSAGDGKFLNKFRPTEGCADAMSIPASFQLIDRLAVEPAQEFTGEVGGQTGQGKFSQYRKLRPTMYSGKMKSVVQALMGFGRQRKRGNREFSIYDEMRPRIRTSKRDQLTQYQRDVAKNGLQIMYDWRFSRTHGISSAADGKLWIVEISITQGVIAMPLPLNRYTTEPGFRDRLVDAGDADGISYIDAFGGFPTGEPFPPDAQMESWIRAGRLIRLCEAGELDPFYALSGYGSWTGWAFNDRGDEAHNTAYYHDISGLMHGSHYMLPISIGASSAFTASARAKRLAARYEALRTNPTYADRVDAVKWKCGRLDGSQVEEAALIISTYVNGLQSSFEYVDGITLAPLATCSSHLSRSSDGYLYNPSRTGNLIKFPEPEIGLLLSVEMRPSLLPVATAAASKRCDTLMHVFFKGNEMKWVKYYRDPDGTGRPASHEDDFEECMFIGRWSSHDDFGVRKTSEALYTNDFDDRAEYPAGESTTTIVGVDMGYSDVYVTDDITMPAHGTLGRRKRFRLTTSIQSAAGDGMSTGVVVPFHDREAYYYAYARGSNGTSASSSSGYQYVTDPYSCRTWRNFPGYTGDWAGDGENVPWYLVRAAQHPDGCGPVTARTVWSDGGGVPIYSPGACSDVADSGPWCFVCDNADAMTMHVPDPPLPPPSSSSTGATLEYRVHLVSGGGIENLRTFEGIGSFSDWPLHSPMADPQFSSNQYAEETHNALGSATVMRYSLTINGALATVGGPVWSGIESGTLTFVGIIHG